ncbi:efflux RND transporter periplasmic adaptor subunit [Falsiroseomonas sp. CW058]|uniref:efflux RND transporter periplasmic adaptor subunit n=1 Tax=Falsiroseomonas sp. CW058 TaxID=3388664 RepID=UPI003D321CEB
MFRPLRALLLAVALATLAPAALAHPGHGDEAPPPSNAAPRGETHSDLFEVVAVLGPDGRLWIYLERHATNEPLEGAALELTIDGQPVQATRAGEAMFVASSPTLAAPGTRNLLFTVSAGSEMDLLPATLDVPTAVAAVHAEGGLGQTLANLVREPFAWAGAVLFLLLGVLLGRASAPRRLPPLVEEERRPEAVPETVAPKSGATVLPKRAAAAASVVPLAAFLVALFAAGHAVAQPMDAPRRQPDGSVFVPKPTQRLLGVRTAITARADAPVSVQVVGQVMADPNASGRVQAPQGGRIEPPEGGFPTLGSRVARGQVLAWIVPVLAAQERSGVQASIAELDAQIAIAQGRVQRLSGLAGSVSAREIAEARAELEGLRQRRAAIGAGLNGREPVHAPAAGVVSVVNAIAGQIVDAREPLFEVVDPQRLWVEAVAFDPSLVAEVAAAAAVTTAGQPLRLSFIGRGLALRQQAIPLQFRIEDVPPGLSVGTPVTVTMQTPRRAGGVVLPADAVVRSAEGSQIVFEMPGAERFVPRPVRVQPLDGRNVLVTAGLDPGIRVVTQAASLVAQVR